MTWGGFAVEVFDLVAALGLRRLQKAPSDVCGTAHDLWNSRRL